MGDLLWLSLNPDAIFGVQVKRLHEYKRQLLNALHIVALWMKARRDSSAAIARAAAAVRRIQSWSPSRTSSVPS